MSTHCLAGIFAEYIHIIVSCRAPAAKLPLLPGLHGCVLHVGQGPQQQSRALELMGALTLTAAVQWTARMWT